MARTVREVMTSDPICLDAKATAEEAARRMRDADVGNVIVVDDEGICGIVTDRDITIRAVAEGRDAASTMLNDVCTTNPTTVTPDTSLDEAIQVMKQEAIRRLPVVDEDNRPVGIVSLGDVAVEDVGGDEETTGQVLADISAAPANN